jgi:hypothetical protein
MRYNVVRIDDGKRYSYRKCIYFEYILNIIRRVNPVGNCNAKFLHFETTIWQLPKFLDI